jgi:peptidoglycan/xylan/chitin deacetylase (PgdA/CDA1 family)
VGTGAAPQGAHRPPTAAELAGLCQRYTGLLDIGAHTRTHQVLSARSESEQRDEIVGSKEDLERVCGRPIRAFSYPHGEAATFTAETERIVREAGFTGACTTVFGTVTPWMDRYAVPRCPSDDIDGETFARRVDAWFEMGR